MNFKNKTLFIDLDGTLYRGDEKIESAITFVHDLQEQQIPFFFLTNNAMRTHQQNTDKLLAMGYQNIHPEQFFTSAMAASRYAKHHQFGNRVFCLGESGLQEALLEQGFELCEEDVDCVVVGLDSHATYHRYSDAYRCLMNNAFFIATNPDRRIPTGQTSQIGNGAIVKMLEYASEKECLMIGKPHTPMLEEMLLYANVDKFDCIIIGDNLETDIAFGVSHDVETIFVTTGVHTKEDQERFQIHATHCVSKLTELMEHK